MRAAQGAATLLLTLLSATNAHAWGSFGHRIVAETAALLVQDSDPDGLGNVLARHRFELGVYAFRPDSTFRHHDEKDGAAEGPLHFLSVDALTDMSLDAPYAAIEKQLAAKDATEPVGRVPWRIDQLARLASEPWRRVPSVSGTYQRGTTAKDPQHAVFEALYYMGVLAHYTGDIAVPHHATKDSNSFAKNQGGLHFYFEGDCVEVFEPDLAPAVLALARKQRKAWIAAHGGKDATAVHYGLSVLQDSLKKLKELERLDKDNALVSAGTAKTFAKRKPAAEGCKALRPMVEERLALGATITAELWQRAIPKGIDWSRSRTLQFNDLHEGEFIAFP